MSEAWELLLDARTSAAPHSGSSAKAVRVILTILGVTRPFVVGPVMSGAMAVAATAVVVGATLFIRPVTSAYDRITDDQVIIDATGVRPRVLHTTTARRVTFVNRSGQRAHVEFLGDAAGHRVFQVPGEMWAVFHRAGRHPYAVHLEGKTVVEFRGVVEVAGDPHDELGPHTCSGRTVMGNCIEP
jgi:hypothetical protein